MTTNKKKESTNDSNLQMTANKNIHESKVLYPGLSYTVVGVLFSVHNELGQYAREKQYGDLLEHKLKEAHIACQREKRLGDSGNIPDFIIDNKIALELKAIPTVSTDCYRQIQNYLHQADLKLGILVNFRKKYLKPQRIIRIERSASHL